MNFDVKYSLLEHFLSVITNLIAPLHLLDVSDTVLLQVKQTNMTEEKAFCSMDSSLIKCPDIHGDRWSQTCAGTSCRMFFLKSGLDASTATVPIKASIPRLNHIAEYYNAEKVVVLLSLYNWQLVNQVRWTSQTSFGI